MRACKTLIDYTSLLSPYDLEKNNDIILSYFKNEWIAILLEQLIHIQILVIKRNLD